jgi:predicted Ser/Thr protein kinase
VDDARHPDSTLDMESGAHAVAGDPERIGRFVVRARLGAGGMGVVYAGEDEHLHRSVAIKLVRGDAEHPSYRARLMREAQAMARLEHPNIVRVYEIGEADGRMFIAMELIDGATLASWLAKRPWRDVISMFVQAGEGLAAVHRAGLVHRDFKPENVLVDRDGRARVCDFGLARLEVPAAAPLTQTGALMGTPAYMAPEQMLGVEVDARADQYSFCVALREALGGRPVDDERWQQVPERIRAAISRGLSYDPDERYASMDELLAALRAGAVDREPRWIVAIAAVAVLGIAAGVVAYISSHGEDHEVVARPLDARPVPIAVVPADAAEADASLEVAEVPEDADVARAPVRVDAGVARSRPPGDAAVAKALPPITDAAIDYQALRKPAANVKDPSHLPAVRATIRGLGYDGIDSRTADDPAFAQIQAAMKKRRDGDCTVASRLWQDAIETLAHNDSDAAHTWIARAWLGRGLCALADGRAAEAWENATHAFVHGNQDEVRLVMAIAAYDKGERQTTHAMMIELSQRTDAHIQAALKTWLEATGLVL